MLLARRTPPTVFAEPFHFRMGVMGRHVARKLGSFLLALGTGCGLFGGEDEPSISLAVSSTTAVVQQAGTLPITLEIGRSNFEKPVTLAVEGTLPSGITATFSQNPVAANATTAIVTIAASGTATPGIVAVTIKATGEGVAEKAILIDVTVNVRGSHTVALTSSALTVAQGGGGQSSVLLARQNNNAGNVTLSATGAPAGMTVTFGESPTTSTGTSVTVTATASVAPGTYNVSIAGSQPGLTPNPTPAVLAVTVTTPPATTAVSIPFCASGIPVWFAYQNDGYLWQRVTPTGNAFNFAATDKLAVAFVYQDAGDSEARFYLATRSELAGITDRDCEGSKNHPGTTSNVSTAQTAILAMGPAFDVVSNNTFLMEGVPDRTLDLVGARGTLASGLFTPDRMVIRRGVNIASGTSIPVIDFQGPESVVPASNNLSVAGMELGESVYIENVFQATTATTGLLFSTQGTSNTHSMYAAPAASLVAGDLNELYIDAFNASGTVAHTLVTYFSTPGDRTETLGPLLTNPTVTVAASMPYLRERGQLASQTAYPTAARFVYLQGTSQSDKFIVVVVTAAYLGGVPATWDVIVPDVSGVTGFNNSWMHVSGQTTAFSAEAFSAPGGVLFGQTPTVGQSVRFAFRQSSVSTSVGSALRASTVQRRHALDVRRGLLDPLPQYLRR